MMSNTFKNKGKTYYFYGIYRVFIFFKTMVYGRNGSIEFSV
jgi:hypothetical protein